jgi:hypothetical protein
MALNKHDARRILAECNVNPALAYHALNSDTVLCLHDAMKASSYRAPATRNGSATRYFHAYLVRLLNRAS